jgi:small subunit ribosomal protein S20
MPNTKSAVKAVRSSKRKNAHNLFWKKRIKEVLRNMKKGVDSKESEEILRNKFVALQKVLDKSAKEKVIHKNRANRLKSIYAGKITVLSKPEQKSKSGRKPSK